MRDDWRACLMDSGAVIEDSTVVDFGNPTRERRVVNAGGVLADLSHEGLIAVRGADAQKHLMSQLTNDVTKVSPQLSQLNGYCTPQGRLLAVMRVFLRGDAYYLALPRDRVEATTKRLRMYALNAKVAIEDAADSLIRIGAAGPKMDVELARFVDVPAAVDQVAQAAGLTVIRLAGITPRFEILGEFDAVKKLWNALTVNAAPVGADAWLLTDILAGIPRVSGATVEEFIPQMLNLQAIGGVSFTKGCYPGQEIVARTKYLGKLKRRMFIAHSDTSRRPNPGDDVFLAPAAAEPQKVGKIVCAAPAQDKGYSILVVMEIAQEEQALALDAPSGPALRLMALPYSVDS